MMSSDEMRKLGIVGPKAVLRKVIEALYHLKACHIRDHTKDASFDIGSPLENASSLSEALVRVRSLISHLAIGEKGEKEESVEKSSFSGISARTKALAAEINALVGQKRAVEARLSALSSKKAKASQLKSSAPVQAFFSLKSLKGFCGTIPQPEEEAVKGRVPGGSFSYESAPAENGRFISFFVRAERAAETEEFLSGHGFVPLDIRELEGYEGPSASIEAGISSEIAKLGKRQSHIAKELEGFAKKHKAFLLSAEALLKEELLKAEAPLRFGTTRELFLVTGWVPAAKVDEAVKAITRAAQGKIHIEVEEPGHGEDVPVKLSNPAPVDSFESLVRLFSWPKYGEVDPTALMALTLPIFFGMMLGDIGYGVITLFLFMAMKRKFPSFAPFFTVLITGSISTIVFGFFFGELFGLEQVAGHELWHVLNRAHEVGTLMVITLIIGVVHVNFGYALGAYNEWKSHGFMAALTHKISWMLVEAAAALWYVAVAVFPSAGWKALAGLVTAAALTLVYKGEGFIGIIEIPSLISHIVSYIRIMAVGLASVFLALLVNQFTGVLFAKGAVWFVLLGIPLIIIGHGFNLALGILSPFLHAVRLHYVEFFTKFYQGGGREFAPFGEQPKEQPL